MSPDTFSRWSDLTGVRRSHAQEIIKDPDDVEIVEFNGLVIQGFTKRITQSKRENHTIVLAEQMPGKAVEMVCALVAYSDVLTAAGSAKPFALLREITNRFGAVIHIGATPKRLYLAETVPLVPGESLTQGHPPMISDISGDLNAISIMMVQKDPWVAKCGLCFGICGDRYRPYVANPPKS